MNDECLLYINSWNSVCLTLAGTHASAMVGPVIGTMVGPLIVKRKDRVPVC